MKEYSNKDIASIVGIAGTTVRKYAQILEKSGHVFDKNELGHRIFHDHEIVLFKEMKVLSDSGALPLERIADMVVAKEKQSEQERVEPVSNSATPLIHKDPSTDIALYDERYTALMEKLQKLDMLDDLIRENQELKSQLKELEEKMDHRFTETVRAMQETRKMIAASEEKKKTWWKFWEK